MPSGFENYNFVPMNELKVVEIRVSKIIDPDWSLLLQPCFSITKLVKSWSFHSQLALLQSQSMSPKNATAIFTIALSRHYSNNNITNHTKVATVRIRTACWLVSLPPTDYVLHWTWSRMWACLKTEGWIH